MTPDQNWVISALTMLVAGFAYFFLSKRFSGTSTKLSQKNGNGLAITGAGGILVLTILLYAFLGDTTHTYFLFAFSMLAVVNWLDDLYEVHSGWRLITQFLSVSFLVMEFGLVSSYWSPFFLVVAVGVINAYNFMDGINGLSGVYGLAVLLPLALILPVNEMDTGQITLVLLFLILFLVFNFRSSAKVILGDVGSVSLGFLVLFYSVKCFKDYDIYLLVSFSMLFLLDSGITLVERTLKRENVFQSHKSHLYQLLVRKKGYDQRWVALGYGVLQLVINLILIELPGRREQVIFSLLTATVLFIGYFFWKKSILQRSAVVRPEME